MSNPLAEYEAGSACEEAEESISLDLARGLHCLWGTTTLRTAADDELEPIEKLIESDTPAQIDCRFLYEEGWEVSHVFTRESADHWRVSTKVAQKASTGKLSRVTLGRDSQVLSPVCLNRVFWQTEAMDGFGGIQAAPPSFTSWGMAALSSTGGSPAFLAGFAGHERYCSNVSGLSGGAEQGWQMEFSCDLEDREIHKKEGLRLPDFLLRTGDSLSSLLEEYADVVGKQMGVRTLPPSPRGWCSWYCYYGTESEEDILRNLENLSHTSLAGSGAVFQIDDGWNLPTPGHARVWGDWLPGKKFSRGMAWIAGKIREKNLTPGLWLAPFSVDKASQLAQDHPEWLVQTRDAASGRLHPAPLNDGFALDLTRKDVLDFIRNTFRRVFSEWGFDYVKIDFLKHAIIPGIRQDATITSRQALRNALGIIREEAGPERFILGCGCPFGPAIGICDGMRIGMDVGGGWDPPLTLPEWPDGNCCVKAAAKPAFYRHWMHRRWWINDPDCVIARQEPLPCEVEELTKIAKQFSPPPRAPQFCLSDEEADFWVNLVSVLGGSVIFSDIWTALPPARRQLLEQALCFDAQPVKWIDWYADPELCFLRSSTEPLLIGIFNFSDKACFPSLPAEKLGLSSWCFREKATGTMIHGNSDRINFPFLSPRSSQIWDLVSP